MISIIISTHNTTFFQQVSQSIDETIGVEYEIIAIENHMQYSLCEAYNLGIKKAKFPYLCFLHEDIVFISNDWGKRLIKTMCSDPTIGLIGVAGSKFKSTYPTTGWGTGPFIYKFWRGQFYTYYNDKKTHIELDRSLSKNEVESVLIVDGVFLFTKCEVLETCKFDSELLTHFHGYDTDFSLQVYFHSYKVIVDRGIEIVHFSHGILGGEFVKANKKIHKKWISKLPIATSDLELNSIELHFYNLLSWIGYFWIAFKRNLKV